MAKILILEDNPLICRIASIALTINGHEVTTFDNIQAAQSALVLNTPDVVITDVHLPSGSGLGLLEWIREHHLNTRVILTSGQITPTIRDAARKFGAEASIPKPFTMENLTNTVAFVLASKSSAFASQV